MNNRLIYSNIVCLLWHTPDVDLALKVRHTNQTVTIVDRDGCDDGGGHGAVRGCNRET